MEALLVGRRLTLMELARHFPGAERIKAPLKRLDRLLGNCTVQALRTPCYQTALRWLLRMPRPVLIVDWSDLKPDRRYQLLRAAVVARGRALTVYEEVHPLARLGSPRVEAAFLKRLKALLPEGMRPILLADAGFRVPWFRQLERLGWHFIARARHRSRVRLLNTSRPNHWIASKTLYARATPRAVSLGEAELTESKRFACRLVLVRRARRGRVHLTRYGQRARSGHSRKMARREREPGLLAASVSLAELSGAEIVALYARRMQIEQSFRDLKSHRYGAAFEDSLTRDPRRLEMLLLIHALATLAAWLEGLAVVTTLLTAHRADRMRRSRHSVVWL
nr:IS4 family transposase [Gammaproteobacteria bacterium]NIR85330.1 IS4 family transposase [Gammaproteobacteria bacterium]NIR88502.1 IS4 family transposase [Gammaproteobacteria bacterium]NIU06396.1 IS4 family transposase [Gammaproteobacteria bacterium]NIV73761.1 IS4 family transposase [Gammaproteobacteria bacterium]